MTTEASSAAAEIETSFAPDDGELTAAEQAYFSSRGEKTEGLASDTGPDVAPEQTKPAEPAPDRDAAKQELKADPPEGGEAELDDDGKPVNKGQWIRHGAFHAERERRKALEREMSELREKFARGDERMRLLTEALSAPAAEPAKAEPEAAPDPEQDIFGYARHLEKRLGDVAKQFETRLGEVTGQVRQTAEQSQAEREERALTDAYVSDARSFMGKTPDFGAAYQHLMQSRGQQLALLGHDPGQIPAMLAREERALVQQAMAGKRSPSEVIYNFAKSFGYAPRDEAAHEPAKTGDKPTVTEQIERIKSGQGAAKSLSNAGGGASNAFTPAALAEMSQDDFNALYEKLGTKEGGMRALLGG